MKVVDLQEAKANLERLAKECRSSPIVVTVDGKPAFEMVPVYSDDPDFVDRLLEENTAFRSLLEGRHRESQEGKVSSLEEVRKRRVKKSSEERRLSPDGTGDHWWTLCTLRAPLSSGWCSIRMAPPK